MTTMESPAEHATAAASGASATERFHADKSPFEAVKDTPPNGSTCWPARCLTRCTPPSASTGSATTSTTP